MHATDRQHTIDIANEQAAIKAKKEAAAKALIGEEKDLASQEVLVQTNSGTYGAEEACRKIGTGDPAFADYRIFERVGDKRRRAEGCHPDKAPGYARHMGKDELRDLRARLADVRKLIKSSK